MEQRELALMTAGSQRVLKTLLGAGGRRPGIDVVNLDSGEVTRICQMPAGFNVSAIALAPSREALTFGTSNRLLYYVKLAQDAQGVRASAARQFHLGAPALAVCFAKDTLIAVGDAARRCLLWDCTEEYPPQRFLETGGEVVCGLLRPSEQSLTGLTLGGRLLFWRMPEGELEDEIEVPKPPRPPGSSVVVHWEADNSLAYASANGDLVRCDLRDHRLQTRRAHPGGFWAIAEADERRLATAGRYDQTLKVWSPGAETPEETLQAPNGIVSIRMEERLEKALILHEDGSASINTREGDRLRQLHRLPTRSYRVSAGPSPRELQAFNDTQNAARAQQIAVEISQKLPCGQPEGIEPLHASLVELGYERVSLGFRAEAARRAKDPVAELKARVSLTPLLPNAPGAIAALEVYARLLERFGQPQEARETYRRILSIEPQHWASQRFLEISSWIQAKENSCWVLETDLPIPVLVEAAAILDRPFRSCCLLKSIPRQPAHAGHFTPMQIAAKYEQVRQDDDRLQQLPPAQYRRVQWICEQTAQERDLVVFGHEKSSGPKGLLFALEVHQDSFQTATVPSTLFDASLVDPGSSGYQHGQAVLDAFEKLHGDPLANPWLKAIHRAVNAALCRLENLGHTNGRPK